MNDAIRPSSSSDPGGIPADPGRRDREHRTGDRRAPEPRVLLVLPLVVAIVVMVSTAIGLAADLPARIPTRWGLDGTVTATTSLWPYTALVVLVAVLDTTLLVVIRDRVGPAGVQRVVGGLAVGVPAALATLHVGTLLEAVDGRGDGGFPGAVGLAAVLVLVVGELAGAALVRPVHHHTVVIDPVPVDVAPGEAVVWTTRIAAPAWLRLVLATVGAVGAAIAALVQLLVGVLVLVGAALALGLLSARVTVGPAGLRVRTGPLGVVRMTVATEDVVGVDAIDVDPLVHGGWGLRLMPGLRAVVLRRGPGLRVVQRDGPVTIITLDGAPEAAGVLRAHVEAAARHG